MQSAISRAETAQLYLGFCIKLAAAELLSDGALPALRDFFAYRGLPEGGEALPAWEREQARALGFKVQGLGFRFYGFWFRV